MTKSSISKQAQDNLNQLGLSSSLDDTVELDILYLSDTPVGELSGQTYDHRHLANLSVYKAQLKTSSPELLDFINNWFFTKYCEDLLHIEHINKSYEESKALIKSSKYFKSTNWNVRYYRFTAYESFKEGFTLPKPHRISKKSFVDIASFNPSILLVEK